MTNPKLLYFLVASHLFFTLQFCQCSWRSPQMCQLLQPPFFLICCKSEKRKKILIIVDEHDKKLQHVWWDRVNTGKISHGITLQISLTERRARNKAYDRPLSWAKQRPQRTCRVSPVTAVCLPWCEFHQAGLNRVWSSAVPGLWFVWLSIRTIVWVGREWTPYTIWVKPFFCVAWDGWEWLVVCVTCDRIPIVAPPAWRVINSEGWQSTGYKEGQYIWVTINFYWSSDVQNKGQSLTFLKSFCKCSTRVKIKKRYVFPAHFKESFSFI